MQAVRVNRCVYNYSGLILSLVSAMAVSLTVSLDDGHLSLIEALRAFLQGIIAGVAFSQSPFSPHPHDVATNERARIGDKYQTGALPPLPLEDQGDDAP